MSPAPSRPESRPRPKPGSSPALSRRLSWWAVFLGCLLPLAWLAWRWSGYFYDTGAPDLGANPIQATNWYLGQWALRFLLIGLALTPVRLLTGWTWPVRFRRMIGLYAFFYVALHLTSWAGVDYGFDWDQIWGDIVKRWYITIGMAAFLLLAPLAATSTAGMIKRMGGRNWLRLHKAVYLAAVLGVIHYLLLVKADMAEPFIYGGILIVLLAVRAVYKLRKPKRQARRRPAATPTPAQ